jgi:hypothetical protein
MRIQAYNPETFNALVVLNGMAGVIICIIIVIYHLIMRFTILILLVMFSFLNLFGKKEISYEKRVAKPTFKIIDMNEEWMRRKYLRDTSGLHDFEGRTARKMMKFVSALKECYAEIPDSAAVKPRVKSLIENFQNEQDIMRSLQSDNNTFIQNVIGISFMVPDTRRKRKTLFPVYRP